jgi:hypothetical protein
MPVKAPTLVLLANLVATAAFAEPNKEQYELHEHCGKRAADVFKELYHSDEVIAQPLVSDGVMRFDENGF